MPRKPVKTASFYGVFTRFDDGTTSQDVEYLPWEDVPSPSPPDPPGPRLLTGFGPDRPLRKEVGQRHVFFGDPTKPQQYQSDGIEIQGWRRSWGFSAGPDGLGFAVNPTHDKNRHGMASLVHPELIDGVVLNAAVGYAIEWAHELQAPPTKWVNSWQTYARRESGDEGNILGSFIKPADTDGHARVHFTHQAHRNMRSDSRNVFITEWPATLRCKVEVKFAEDLKVWYAVDENQMEQVMELGWAGSSNGLGRQGIGVYSPKPYAATVPYYRISVVD